MNPQSLGKVSTGAAIIVSKCRLSDHERVEHRSNLPPSDSEQLMAELWPGVTPPAVRIRQ